MIIAAGTGSTVKVLVLSCAFVAFFAAADEKPSHHAQRAYTNPYAAEEQGGFFGDAVDVSDGAEGLLSANGSTAGLPGLPGLPVEPSPCRTIPPI